MRGLSRCFLVLVALTVLALIAPKAEAGGRRVFFPRRPIVVAQAPVIVNGFPVHSNAAILAAPIPVNGAATFFVPRPRVIVPFGFPTHGGSAFIAGGCF